MATTVFITGASTGIGSFIANKLHQSGYKVYGTSRNPEKHQAKVPFELLRLDITSDESVEKCVAELFSKTSTVDVLINNAGDILQGVVEETPIESAKQQFETNFWGSVRVTKALLPFFRKQRSGKIISTGSLSGLVGMPNAAYYSASKHAIEGFYKSLRFELKQFNVKVSVIEPSFFKTNINENAASSFGNIDDYKNYREKVSAFINKSVEDAPEPSAVGKTVIKIIKDKNPAFSYPVGKGTTILPILQNLFYKTFENAFLKQAKV